ncbi:hypothetical protein KUCAC02_027085 [Chaenocephalus aceratus]|uniref:Uncharacterized protein n=1 Tax=Chaenocephalus aceratus TaxID=36190 RepID=A0ACB9W2Q0_CHAAC|nr:hypothetical protein KUCAC02_027085 [Chaenocephalus aceratus]
MLPAVVKLCCGISYPHLRSLAGLQRTAVAVIGKELTHLQRWGRVQPHMSTHGGIKYNAPGPEDVKPLKEDQDFYTKGWKIEFTESEGEVICSKVVAGAGKVFRLEAVLEASVEELYDLLFVRVEEMHQWNPSIQQIKVLKHVGPETIITHEVSAETAGNCIGQRDFLSVRHSRKQKSSVYLGGAAIQLASFPPQAGFVRAEDGPTCIIIQALGDETGKSRFTWLLNMDVKGWLPKSIVNQALPRAQLDFTRHLRRRLTARATLG